MDIDTFKQQYSMPLSDPAYAQPPYCYRNVEDAVIWFEADASKVKSVLPPRLTLTAGRARCGLWLRWVPFSAFGPYHETYVMVDVELDGVRYLYQPFIFVDNDIPMLAGREIWGFAKKLAQFTSSYGGHDQSAFGEQLVYNVERPSGQPLVQGSMVAQRKATIEELGEDLPVLSFRHIPSADGSDSPSVSELVRLDVTSALRTSADGSYELYAGAGHAELFDSASDRLGVFKPVKYLEAFFMKVDFDLGYGKVVHDYLKDVDVWG